MSLWLSSTIRELLLRCGVYKISITASVCVFVRYHVFLLRFKRTPASSSRDSSASKLRKCSASE